MVVDIDDPVRPGALGERMFKPRSER
jgi:hypothetical protein